jgi:L-asparaginase II
MILRGYMSEIVIEKSRGEVVESIFRGDIAIVQNGKLTHYLGDPYKYTYMRSAAKPIQTIGVILSGAMDRFKLTEEELAIMCASHYGEDRHREVVQDILDKIGLEMDSIKGGIVNSLSKEYGEYLLKSNVELNQLYSDCSGKHAGKLATALSQDEDIERYLDPDHPLQQSILRIISDICEYPQSKISIGIDGCSAPVHGFPLINMAIGFEKFANPLLADSNYHYSLDKIFNSMINNPFMISGSKGFCTELITGFDGKLIGKIGAEGIYCIAIKPESESGNSIGIAIKMEDGNMDYLPVVVMEVLNQLDLTTDLIEERLSQYFRMENRNDLNTIVGFLTPNFSLKSV